MPRRSSCQKTTVFQIKPESALYFPPEHNNGEEDEKDPFFERVPEATALTTVLRPEYTNLDDVFDISPMRGSTQYRVVPDHLVYSETEQWLNLAKNIEVISLSEMKFAPHGKDRDFHMRFLQHLPDKSALYNCTVHLGKGNKTLYNFEQMHLHLKFFHGVLLKVGSMVVHGTHAYCCDNGKELCSLEVRECGELAIISSNYEHKGSIFVTFDLRIPAKVDLWNAAKWRDFISVHKHFKLSKKAKLSKEKRPVIMTFGM